MSCVGNNRKWSDLAKHEKRANRKVMGTLLVLVVGIVATSILLAIVGLDRSYRDRSNIPAAISTAESIRVAFAEYIGESASHAVPTAESLRDYTTLRALVNQYGGMLRETEESMGIRFEGYETQDTNHDGLPDDYILLLSVPSVSHRYPGQRLRVTPAGIEKLPQR